MLVDAVLMLKKVFIKWGEEFFKEEELRDNPFVFEHQAVLDAASDYLKTYIEKEIEKVIHDRQVLIFTNSKDMPFAREDEQKNIHLEEMLTYIEQEISQPLTEYEKAYLTYIFYNDTEQSIINGALYATFLKGVTYKEWDMYLFLHKIGLLLKEGQEILFTDLQELCAAYTWRKIWQYHMEG
nr:hypothetical protein [uncultured Niameybacter sp.]